MHISDHVIRIIVWTYMVDCGLAYMFTLHQIYSSLFNKRNDKTLFLSSKPFIYLTYNAKSISVRILQISTANEIQRRKI